MIVFAWLVEKLVLKHLINQAPIILFMANYRSGLFHGRIWRSDVGGEYKNPGCGHTIRRLVLVGRCYPDLGPGKRGLLWYVY